MAAAIFTEKLSKKYQIQARRQGNYLTLRDSIGNLGKRLISPFAASAQQPPESEEFWALQDVSISVPQGGRFGILGRNGAGKSTLLKILSRVIRPTAGSAILKGRVASLLEVGTGFHPELSGRENIFFNGTLLGMRRHEILRKFDEIVAFAELEKFIDTPVKRYSSGMYVRLAFAVAAHLEPDILIVDEVLAVGDAQFQKKCLGKMEEASKHEGRTVLLVSHNMAAIEALCTSALYLKKGRAQLVGPASEVIKEYMKDVNVSASMRVSERTDRDGKGMVVLKDIKTVNTGGTNSYAVGDHVLLELQVENRYPDPVSVRFSMSLRNSCDVGLIACDTAMTGELFMLARNSLSTVTCKIFSPPLNYGEYYLNVTILNNDQVEDWVASALRISFESGTFHNHIRQVPFPVLTQFEWKLEGKETALSDRQV